MALTATPATTPPHSPCSSPAPLDNLKISLEELSAMILTCSKDEVREAIESIDILGHEDHEHIRRVIEALYALPNLQELLATPITVHPDLAPHVPGDPMHACLMSLLSPLYQEEGRENCFVVSALIVTIEHDPKEILTTLFALLELGTIVDVPLTPLFETRLEQSQLHPLLTLLLLATELWHNNTCDYLKSDFIDLLLVHLPKGSRELLEEHLWFESHPYNREHPCAPLFLYVIDKGHPRRIESIKELCHFLEALTETPPTHRLDHAIARFCASQIDSTHYKPKSDLLLFKQTGGYPHKIISRFFGIALDVYEIKGCNTPYQLISSLHKLPRTTAKVVAFTIGHHVWTLSPSYFPPLSRKAIQTTIFDRAKAYRKKSGVFCGKLHTDDLDLEEIFIALGVGVAESTIAEIKTRLSSTKRKPYQFALILRYFLIRKKLGFFAPQEIENAIRDVHRLPRIIDLGDDNYGARHVIGFDWRKKTLVLRLRKPRNEIPHPHFDHFTNFELQFPKKADRDMVVIDDREPSTADSPREEARTQNGGPLLHNAQQKV